MLEEIIQASYTTWAALVMPFLSIVFAIPFLGIAAWWNSFTDKQKQLIFIAITIGVIIVEQVLNCTAVLVGQCLTSEFGVIAVLVAFGNFITGLGLGTGVHFGKRKLFG